MKNSVSVKVSVFLLLLILFPTLVSANWVAESPLSTPRDQFTGGVINGKIYVFGGNGDPNGVNLKSTEMFDPATQSWTYQATNENNNGFGVEELTGAVVNGKLYVFGAYGEGYPPYGVFNFVEEYDPITNTWTSKASMPTTRSGETAAVYNGEIYVFGGSLGGPDPRPHTDVVEAYNPVTNTWRFVTNMPKVVANPAIAVVGDKAYLIGGYFLDEDRMLEDVIVYDFQTGTWITTDFTPLPTPRAFPYSHAVPVVDGKIYLVGGVMGTLASSWTPLDVVEIYDTITDTWSTGPLLPQPTDHYLTVLLNRTIYVIGGITEDGTRTGAVWKLNAVQNAVIPDVKANGSDSSITIPQGGLLTVTVSLDSGGRNGEQADWWVVADTPFGWYHYDVGSGSWIPGLVVTHQGPLFDLTSPFEILNMSGLPIGTYTFYFGVDMVMNGSLDMDQIYYDSVEVNVE